MAEVAGPNPAEPIVLLSIGYARNARFGLSVARIVTKKKHNQDKKLHKLLHNSDTTDDGEQQTSPDRSDLTWQETVDLLPEDEVEGGSEIYYFTDEDGNIHSREFLAEELVPTDDQDLKDLLKRKQSYKKVERLKPGTLDIVGLVGSPPQQPQQQKITLPLPKSGAHPFDIRISSEVAPDLPIKKVSRKPSNVVAEERRVIVHLHDGSAADEPIITEHDAKTTQV